MKGRTKQRPLGVRRGASFVPGFLEATGGFEPPNRGFADPRLRPLGYVALFSLDAEPMVVVPRRRLELLQP